MASLQALIHTRTPPSLALSRFVRGSKNLHEAFSRPVTAKEIEQERRYLYPSMLLKSKPEVTHRKVDYTTLPPSHPARDINLRPMSSSHFTGYAKYYDILTDLQVLQKRLDKLALSEMTPSTVALLNEELNLLHKLDDHDAALEAQAAEEKNLSYPEADDLEADADAAASPSAVEEAEIVEDIPLRASTAQPEVTTQTPASSLVAKGQSVDLSQFA